MRINDNLAPGDHAEELTKFTDQKMDHTVDFTPPLDPTFGTSDTSNSHLQDFLERPLNIFSFAWNVGSGVNATFNPWDLFMTNPRVINRITNFRNFRGNLNVKITLNGNGFHYGRLLASYLPLYEGDIISKKLRSTPQDAIAESQRPHLYLDPTHSQGGCMTLPFFWYKNNIDIPTGEWDQLGRIVIRSLQSLKHANGATDSVTVTVFAWVTDLHLSGPTSFDSSALVPQAKGPGEFGSRPVSRTANAISAISGALGKFSTIAPFAKATQMVATGIGDLAFLLGFSRPNNLAAIAPYKPMYLGNLANVNANDTALSLALDQKQELTIDPRVCGLNGDDELQITSISTRESYLTQFAWDIADAADAHLFSVRVSPEMFDTVGAGATKEYHLTAAAFAAAPFSYWRGTINYRFMVVASAYQKGRLRIVYDPWYKSGTEYNTNYSTVIDLASNRDFTVEVGWANSRSYCRLKGVTKWSNVPFQATPFTDAQEEFTNGTLSVFVVNELTTPNSTVTNDAAVNVFVSTSDDFEVVAPSSLAFGDLTVFQPQAGLPTKRRLIYHNEPIFPDEYISQGKLQNQAGEPGHADSDTTMQQAAPEMETVVDTYATGELSMDNTLQVFFADPVVSFRSLMKRYCYSVFIPDTSPATAATQRYATMMNYPLYRGYATNGQHSVTTPVNPTPYNFVETPWVQYVTLGFAGVRGSMRWKYALTNTDSNASHMFVDLLTGFDNSPTYDLDTVVSTLSISGSKSSQASGALSLGEFAKCGRAATISTQNPVLEVEIPYYSYDRFLPARSQGVIDPNTSIYRHRLGVEAREQEALTVGVFGVHAYCAAGEDYFPMFYIGPPVFYNQAPPTAV